MLTPDQIQRRALNRYPDFLRSLCTGDPFFPLAVFGAGLAQPKDFVGDRAAIETLRNKSKETAGFGYEITWEQRNFRRLGLQKIPGTVAFPTRDDYVSFLKKQAEVRQFQIDYDLILKTCPELGSWARAKPLKVVAHAGIWEGLLSVCTYLRDHPRPNCYLRELPVSVDTKFIENHRGILSEILPVTSPQTVGADNSRFETRFGFRFKQPLVRIRFMDESIMCRLGLVVDDLAVPLDKFSFLPIAGVKVLIVENEMTFLTIPKFPGTVVIFGAGDAAALLGRVAWLNDCQVFYWGDLDTHGFEILSNLRKNFPHVISVMMDEIAFTHHSTFVVKAAASLAKGKPELTLAEKTLYESLLKSGSLLEQERVGIQFMICKLSEIFCQPGDAA